MKNPRIEKAKYLLEKANGNPDEMKKAINRIQEMLASCILGREFLESCESYFNRKPELKEFEEWTKNITISPSFTLINY